MTVIWACCDICGSDDFSPLYPATITDFDQAPEQYYSSSRVMAGYLPVVRCNGCGLAMANPRDDAQTLAAIYTALNDPDYDLEAKNRILTAQKRVKMLRGWVDNTLPRLLDIGCATGFFAGEAQAAGWQVTGLEPSHQSILHARSRYPQVNFIEGMIEQAGFPPGSFDIITLWDVMEHVHSPKQLLLTVSPWLQKQGLLVLNLPNIDSLPARIMGRRWVLLLREHLWYFSPTTIRKLLEPNGYCVETVQPNWVTFSVENILKRIGQYFPTKSDRKDRKNTVLSNLSISFPMGEMIVIARKLQ